MTGADPQSPAALMIEEMKDRLLRMYPEEVRACLGNLSDEEIWWRPNESSMAVGNMVLHLTGNLNHYLGRGLAGSGYRRDRPAEMEEKGPIARDELVRRFDESVEWARQAFAAATPERLLEIAELGPESRAFAQVLVAVTTHFNGHVGQIIYVTKMIRAGVFKDELWRRVQDR